MIVGDLMTPISAGVSPDDSLSHVIALMAEKKCSCVVVSTDGYPQGIFTERDAVGRLASVIEQQQYVDVKISQVMSHEPVCVEQGTSLYKALLLARNQKLRHLIVVNGEQKIAGLVTQTDMAAAYVSLLERQEQLESDNKHLHLLSNEDVLMKIGNRRAMNDELDFTEASARRYNKSYAIALIDVDYFKDYNDCYGHPMGDRALQMLARAVKSSMRDTDRLYRYGGEELLLLMPETHTLEATVAAERVRKAVEVSQLVHATSPLGYLTISIGVAAGEKAPWLSLVKRADAALYKAKNLGRNTVVSE